MFPATAALAWAVLAYICVDFGFLNKLIEISPGNEQIWRAGTEVGAGRDLRGVPVHLSQPQPLARPFQLWRASSGCCGLLLIAGVAIFDPAVAAGIARLSFAATALVGHRPDRLSRHPRLRPRHHAGPQLGAGAGVAGRVVDDDHRHARQRHRPAGAWRRPGPDHPADRLHRDAACLCRRRPAAGPVLRHGAAGAGRRRLRRHRLGLGRAARPRRDQARRQPAARPGAQQPGRPGPQLAAGAASRRPRPFRTTLDVVLEHRRGRVSQNSACAAPTATTTGSRCAPGP